MISLLGLLTNCRSVYMETLYLLALVPRFRLIFAIIIIRYLLVHQHFSMLPHNLLVQLWVEYGVRCPTLTHGLAMDFVMRFVGRTVGQCRTCASTSAQGRAMEFAMQPVGATIGRCMTSMWVDVVLWWWLRPRQDGRLPTRFTNTFSQWKYKSVCLNFTIHSLVDDKSSLV